MNQRQAILARAERTKSQYPKDRFTVAHLALSGDGAAGLKFMDMVARPRRSLWKRLKRLFA